MFRFSRIIDDNIITSLTLINTLNSMQFLEDDLNILNTTKVYRKTSFNLVVSIDNLEILNTTRVGTDTPFNLIVLVDNLDKQIITKNIILDCKESQILSDDNWNIIKNIKIIVNGSWKDAKIGYLLISGEWIQVITNSVIENIDNIKAIQISNKI